MRMKQNLMQLSLVAVCVAMVSHLASAANVTPTKSNTDFIAGSGIPSDNFVIDTASSGESVALKGRSRDTGQAISFVGDTYTVMNGNSVLSPSNPWWSFDWQFSPGTAGMVAEDYIMTLQVDFDPAIGTTDYATISLPVADADMDPTNSWDDTDGFFTNPGGGDWSDDGVPFVYSQSWNQGFGFWTAPPFDKTYDSNDTGEYQLNVSIAKSSDPMVPIATSSILVEVVPEPCTGLMLLCGCLGLMIRRRK
ncbi:MAG: PEP-CTERM sorting domain-containing protein [Planctomycetota bacterium]